MERFLKSLHGQAAFASSRASSLQHDMAGEAIQVDSGSHHAYQGIDLKALEKASGFIGRGSLILEGGGEAKKDRIEDSTKRGILALRCITCQFSALSLSWLD